MEDASDGKYKIRQGQAKRSRDKKSTSSSPACEPLSRKTSNFSLLGQQKIDELCSKTPSISTDPNNPANEKLTSLLKRVSGNDALESSSLLLYKYPTSDDEHDIRKFFLIFDEKFFHQHISFKTRILIQPLTTVIEGLAPVALVPLSMYLGGQLLPLDFPAPLIASIIGINIIPFAVQGWKRGEKIGVIFDKNGLTPTKADGELHIAPDPLPVGIPQLFSIVTAAGHTLPYHFLYWDAEQYFPSLRAGFVLPLWAFFLDRNYSSSMEGWELCKQIWKPQLTKNQHQVLIDSLKNQMRAYINSPESEELVNYLFEVSIANKKTQAKEKFLREYDNNRLKEIFMDMKIPISDKTFQAELLDLLEEKEPIFEINTASHHSSSYIPSLYDIAVDNSRYPKIIRFIVSYIEKFVKSDPDNVIAFKAGLVPRIEECITKPSLEKYTKIDEFGVLNIKTTSAEDNQAILETIDKFIQENIRDLLLKEAVKKCKQQLYAQIIGECVSGENQEPYKSDLYEAIESLINAHQALQGTNSFLSEIEAVKAHSRYFNAQFTSEKLTPLVDLIYTALQKTIGKIKLASAWGLKYAFSEILSEYLNNFFSNDEYLLRLIPKGSSLQALKEIKPEEVIIFSKNKKLYCKVAKQEKEKEISADVYGLPPAVFNNIWTLINDSSGKKSLSDSDRDELLQYLLEKKHIRTYAQEICEKFNSCLNKEKINDTFFLDLQKDVEAHFKIFLMNKIRKYLGLKKKIGSNPMVEEIEADSTVSFQTSKKQGIRTGRIKVLKGSPSKEKSDRKEALSELEKSLISLLSSSSRKVILSPESSYSGLWREKNEEELKKQVIAVLSSFNLLQDVEKFEKYLNKQVSKVLRPGNNEKFIEFIYDQAMERLGKVRLDNGLRVPEKDTRSSVLSHFFVKVKDSTGINSKATAQTLRGSIEKFLNTENMLEIERLQENSSLITNYDPTSKYINLAKKIKEEIETLDRMAHKQSTRFEFLLNRLPEESLCKRLISIAPFVFQGCAAPEQFLLIFYAGLEILGYLDVEQTQAWNIGIGCWAGVDTVLNLFQGVVPQLRVADRIQHFLSKKNDFWGLRWVTNAFSGASSLFFGIPAASMVVDLLQDCPPFLKVLLASLINGIGSPNICSSFYDYIQNGWDSFIRGVATLDVRIKLAAQEQNVLDEYLLEEDTGYLQQKWNNFIEWAANVRTTTTTREKRAWLNGEIDALLELIPQLDEKSTNELEKHLQ